MALHRKRFPSRIRLLIGLATVCAVLPAGAAKAGISPWAGLPSPVPQEAGAELRLAAPTGLQGSHAGDFGSVRSNALAALSGQDDDDDDDRDDRDDDD